MEKLWGTDIENTTRKKDFGENRSGVKEGNANVGRNKGKDYWKFKPGFILLPSSELCIDHSDMETHIKVNVVQLRVCGNWGIGSSFFPFFSLFIDGQKQFSSLYGLVISS